jgi:hypothetical protein
MTSNPLRVDQSPLAPCIVNCGIVPNKQDMQRLLADLDRVNYVHIHNDRILSQGEGYIQEVFADAQRATLVANRTLYLNVQSFDYIELQQTADDQASFVLVRGDVQLCLTPLSSPLEDATEQALSASALEAAVADALSSNWDYSDDGDQLSF